MNRYLSYPIVFAILATFAMSCPATSESSPTTAVLPRNSQEILNLMHLVADRQLGELKKKSVNYSKDWIAGAAYTGFIALQNLPGGEKYVDGMMQIGEKTAWRLGDDCRFNANGMFVGQMYLDMYARCRKPEMIAHTRQIMDEFAALKDEAAEKALAATNPKIRQYWNWCDALYIAPVVLAKMYTITGDVKYYEKMIREYKRSTDMLFDKEERLFFRDRNFVRKSGKKIFWSRGNGWVFGGLANLLAALPKEAPDRPYFEDLFKRMASRLITLQQPDGLWRASLLDPETYPQKETSGSGFFCYGLAWGINNGLLDRATTLPAVEKAWAALVGCVTPEGKLTYVQPIAAAPMVTFDPNSSVPYGVGAFLLAGCEVYRLYSAGR